MPDNNTEAAEVTPQVGTTEAKDTETFDREYVEKLRAENARYRTRAKQAEEEKAAAEAAAKRAKMDELEAARAELAEQKAAMEALQQQLQQQTWRADLAPSVVDPDAAIKLVSDDFITSEGRVNLDAFFERYPFMRRDATPPKPKSSGAVNSPGVTTSDGPLSPQDFKGKTPEWVKANLHRLKQPDKERRIRFT